MNSDSDWYEDIEKKTTVLKEKIGKKNYQEYELDYLKQIAHKVASYSPKCSECHSNQDKISSMVSGVMDSSQMTKEQREDYFNTFRSVVNHLESHVGKSMIDLPMPGLVEKYMLVIGLILIAIAVGVFVYANLISIMPGSFGSNEVQGANAVGIVLVVVGGGLCIGGVIRKIVKK